MSVRGVLRSLVDRQVAAVNAGDMSALGSLLRGASSSWRIPQLPVAVVGDGTRGPVTGSETLVNSLELWAEQVSDARMLPTQVLLDETQRTAAVEWVLRYQLALPDAGAQNRTLDSSNAGNIDESYSKFRQLLGGTTFELDNADRIGAWHSYSDGARAHQPVPQLDFSDLDPSLSPWQPRKGSETNIVGGRGGDSLTTAAGSASLSADVRRGEVLSLLRREAELWSMTDLPMEISRPYFERVFAEDAKLINPWTVELSRESRWAGFLSFCREYTDCEVSINRVVVDTEQPNLFAVERTFACTNRETGVRGIDEDWALGEIEELRDIGRAQAFTDQQHEHQENDSQHLRLRYCRVYFDVSSSCQERSKSTGARYGWDMPHVVNI